jgi:ornithine--oxo-acid transaminase
MLSTSCKSFRKFGGLTSNLFKKSYDENSVVLYDNLPAVISHAQGLYMYDKEGKKYTDMIMGISACNQGHRHPKIVQAAKDQLDKVTTVSPAVYNEKFAEFAQYSTSLLGFDRVLTMSTGTEATDTAIKLARRFAYRNKKIPADQATILLPAGCFFGRNITASGGSTNPAMKTDYGPFTPGFEHVPYGDAKALDQALTNNKNICAFFAEPIQGEAGVVVPPEGYLTEISKICKKHNVLLMLDEIQSGLGRAGHLMAHHVEEGCKPDVITVSKSLAGGLLPFSAVFFNNEYADLMGIGDHGSTWFANPMGAAVATAALKVIDEEGLAKNSMALGKLFESSMEHLKKKTIVKDIRGAGLFRCIELQGGVTGRDFAMEAFEKHDTLFRYHGNMVRLLPPLNIKTAQLEKVFGTVEEVITSIS